MNTFNLENAKTVFDLFRTVSPYAIPLLISLIYPLVWTIFKKMLGVKKKELKKQNVASDSNFFQKLLTKVKYIFNSLSGDYGDRVIFYSCTTLFLLGILVLKYGEKKEEEIRQKGIELRMNFEVHNSLSEKFSTLEEEGFDRDLLDAICYNYPNQFVAYQVSNEEYLAIVDSSSTTKIKKSIFSLIDSFLKTEFQKKEEVDIKTLVRDDRKGVKGLIGSWHVEFYLSEKLDKEKYSLEDRDSTTVIKRIINIDD